MFGEIKNARGERLDYTFHAGSKNSRNLVVIGHGVTGNKDRPFIVALAEALACSGIPALRFSFSGNGASSGRFVDSTISKEIEDLGAMLDALKGFTIGYAGHSMGGAVGVLLAARDERVELLISLAGMVHTKAFAQREFGNVKPGEGFMWDEPAYPLSQAYMDDLTKLNSVVDSASLIHAPWLLIHGTADDVVPNQDSRDIFARANQPKQLIELEDSNHVFAGTFTSMMIERVIAWLKPKFG